LPKFINNSNISLSDWFGLYTQNPGALNADDYINVGADSTGLSGIQGNITEFILFNKVLTTDENNMVFQYLNSKYWRV